MDRRKLGCRSRDIGIDILEAKQQLVVELASRQANWLHCSFCAVSRSRSISACASERAVR
jgi:hypothetical protein